MLAYSVLVVFAHGSALSLSFSFFFLGQATSFLSFFLSFTSFAYPWLSLLASYLWSMSFPVRSARSFFYYWKGRRFWVNQEKTSSISLWMFRAFALSYNGPGSSRLFIVSLRFCHPPSPRAGFRLLFIALGHSSEMSSVPREGLPTECDPWSPYLIIPDYWIDPIAYLPARTNG
jgi:hypothetical protein